jgi:hypothetical protein
MHLTRLADQSYPSFFTEKSFRNSDGKVLDLPGVRVDQDVSWADDTELHAFGVLPFGTQRLLLLLRAMIKNPDILILDEAFSGMSSTVRDKALLWLTYGESRFLSESPNQQGLVEIPNRRLDFLRNTHELKLDPVILLKTQLKHLVQYQKAHRMKLDRIQRISERNLHIDWQFKGLGQDQALVVVSHIKEEIPAMVNEYVRLPGEEEVTESGRGVELGRCDNGYIRTAEGWNEVWGFG